MKTRLFFPIVGLVIVLLFSVLFLWPRVDHPVGVQAEPTATPALDLAGINGAALYDHLCDKCHGLNEATYGPRLTSPSSTSAEALKTLILKGVPESDMHPLDEPMSPQQLEALVKFLKETALPKSAADKKQLEIGANAARTQLTLQLIPVEGSDTIARATLKDESGASLVKANVVFNKLSSLNARLPLATVQTNEQGVAVYYYPPVPGETVRIEALYEGERGRQASSAVEQQSFEGGTELAPLATGLSAATPPLGLVGLIVLVVGGIWLTYGRVVSLLLEIWSAKSSEPSGGNRIGKAEGSQTERRSLT